jgi:hypothetical protein
VINARKLPIAFKSISVLPINLGTTVDTESVTAAEKKYSREMSGGSRVWQRSVVLRVCEFEGDEAEMLSAREYFSTSPVHLTSRIARQLSEMDWSIAHELREASFWISVRDGFTYNNTFRERRRSTALAGRR